MADSHSPTLAGEVILIVEDEYALASELTEFFRGMGAAVIGPAGTIGSAMALLGQEGPRLSAAVLDINVRNELVFPVADELLALGVPIVFTTGYDQLSLPPRYSDLPRCQKPVDKALLTRAVGTAIAKAARSSR